VIVNTLEMAETIVIVYSVDVWSKNILYNDELLIASAQRL